MSERYAQARATKEGDVWRHLKTGKTLTVLAKPRGIFGQVRVRHESGCETAKRAHYLADEYELIEIAADVLEPR
jgi:hypothetical protein